MFYQITLYGRNNLKKEVLLLPGWQKLSDTAKSIISIEKARISEALFREAGMWREQKTEGKENRYAGKSVILQSNQFYKYKEVISSSGTIQSLP